jgi:hypothetical protein
VIRLRCFVFRCTFLAQNVVAHPMVRGLSPIIAMAGSSIDKRSAVGSLASRWTKHRAVWQCRFPWLDAAFNHNGCTLGCTTCAVAVASSPGAVKWSSTWATFKIDSLASAQPSTFAKHQSSAAHQGCAAKLQTQAVIAPHVAPQAAEFAKVQDAVRSGDTCIDGASPNKFRQMVFALAEARRQRVRAALHGATSISLQQDVRKAQLLVRFSCSDETLRRCTGVLGQCDLAEFGLSAQGVRDGTIYIVYKLATKMLVVPHTTQAGQDLSTDETLLASIQTKTELFAADGAADEQLAGDQSLTIM